MKDRIAYEANARFPEEACGLVLGGQVLLLCDNAAEDPLSSFRVPQDIVDQHWANGTITAVWHSHTFDAAVPSAMDEELAIPGIECWIYSVPDEDLGIYLPDEQGRLQLVRME